MKNKAASAFLLSFFFLGTSYSQKNPYVISFYLRSLPEMPKEQSAEKLAKQLQTPGKILKSILKSELHPFLLYSGVYVAYLGTFTRSTADGQVIFERLTPEAKLHILITEDVKAVPVSHGDKTLSGFVVDPKVPSAQYLFERVKDPETGLFVWHVTAEPVNKNKRISADTLTIFANPKTVIVPLGSTPTSLSENLVLPDLYLTLPSSKSAVNALRFLKVRHYFAPIKFEYRFPPNAYQQEIVS